MFKKIKELFSKLFKKEEVKQLSARGTYFWVGKPRQTPKFK